MALGRLGSDEAVRNGAGIEAVAEFPGAGCFPVAHHANHHELLPPRVLVPFVEQVGDLGVEGRIMAGPRFHQPAVTLDQPRGSLQRLARHKVQEADEHGPLRQRVQGARTAEELWPRHVRQTEAGDDQRDRPASGAQPFENAESALRPQHREDLILASEATLKLPGKARSHARIGVDDQDGGGALRFGHLRRVKDPPPALPHLPGGSRVARSPDGAICHSRVGSLNREVAPERDQPGLARTCRARNSIITEGSNKVAARTLTSPWSRSLWDRPCAPKDRMTDWSNSDGLTGSFSGGARVFVDEAVELLLTHDHAAIWDRWGSGGRRPRAGCARARL